MFLFLLTERNAYRRLTLKFFKKKGLSVEILENSNQKDIKSDFFIELEHDGIKTIKTNSNSKELTNKEILEILADSLKLLKKYDEKTEKFFE